MRSKNRRWHLQSGSINEFAFAPDVFGAFDTLKERSAFDFGMIVQAEPDESADPYPCRTSLLMFRWGRDKDARRFIERMVQLGMPDATAADLKAMAD